MLWTHNTSMGLRLCTNAYKGEAETIKAVYGTKKCGPQNRLEKTPKIKMTCQKDKLLGFLLSGINQYQD